MKHQAFVSAANTEDFRWNINKKLLIAQFQKIIK